MANESAEELSTSIGDKPPKINQSAEDEIPPETLAGILMARQEKQNGYVDRFVNQEPEVSIIRERKDFLEELMQKFAKWLGERLRKFVGGFIRRIGKIPENQPSSP